MSSPLAPVDRLLVRVKTAAEVLDVSRSQIYNLVNDGTLRAVRVGKSIRIPADALREMAKGGQAGAGQVTLDSQGVQNDSVRCPAYGPKP
ncbi:MAG: helix-turn-helix domain-containing protein [Bryobacteraceae bacterium]|jgi:excisionase family DNA binding protein